MRFLKILKREIVIKIKKIYYYFNNNFFLTSIFFKYYEHMKVYNIVKTLDLSTLAYSHTEKTGMFSFDKRHYFIINKKYLISNYRVGTKPSIFLFFSKNEKIDITCSLQWLDETDIIMNLSNAINSFQFQEKIYENDDTPPFFVSLERTNKIKKILS